MSADEHYYTEEMARWFRNCAELVGGAYDHSTKPASGYIPSALALIVPQRKVAVATNLFVEWYRIKYAIDKKRHSRDILVEIYTNLPLAVAGMMSEFSIDITRILAVANTCSGAADLLKNSGWLQGSVVDGAGGYDLLGAVDTVIAASTKSWSMADRALLWSSVLSEIKDYLGTAAIAQWNDAPGRTKREVMSVLRSCASRLRTVAL